MIQYLTFLFQSEPNEHKEMTELTLEALQHFMLENGCKVKSSDAIEFFRLNFGGKDSDLSKYLFKWYSPYLV